MSTETADPALVEIDRWPTERAVAAMVEGQREAIAAVAAETATIARIADAAASRLGDRGRIAYAGAGTSGRVGVQDGVELSPTFGWPEERLAFLIAGGEIALMRAVEGAEDDAEAGREAVRAARLGASDVVIGIAASGRTPYTIGVVEQARQRGCMTVALACNPDTPLLAAAEHAILLDTGSEAVAGSTRMKAGTAQKAALNVLSTAIMLRQGLVYRGQMIAMRISNAKLQTRAVAMVARIAEVSEDSAASALDTAGGNIRCAILVARGMSADEARQRIAQAPRDFARILAALPPR